jgi:hypothetical protein
MAVYKIVVEAQTEDKKKQMNGWRFSDNRV